jgi:acetylornithine/N-succinyldiaminopimelate aminotransferase
MTTAIHPFDALMDITARPQAVFVRGEGAYLWDHTGKRYLDFVQGWAVNCLGHSPPVVADALAAQAKRLLTPSPAFYNDASLKLANALVANGCTRSNRTLVLRAWRPGVAPSTAGIH